ncbi:MAG: glutamine-hydrolyzing GMP synthase, partial [Planctomycetota bacterium]
MSREVVAILDFGSQYGQLIARRVREQNVLSRICRADISAEELSKMPLKGLILSGGPASVYDKNAIKCDEKIFELDVPILGICYGMQLACQILGAKIVPAERREYGRTNLSVLDSSDLLANLPESITAWASHGDQIEDPGHDFIKLGSTETCPFAAVRHKNGKFFGVQFHPEVSHTPKGSQILENFLYDVCDCAGDWKMSDFASETIEAVRKQV